MSIQENQMSDLIDGGLIAKNELCKEKFNNELDEKLKEIHINFGTTSKARYKILQIIDDFYTERDMLSAYEDGTLDEYRYQTEKNYNRADKKNWISNFKKIRF